MKLRITATAGDVPFIAVMEQALHVLEDRERTPLAEAYATEPIALFGHLAAIAQVSGIVAGVVSAANRSPPTASVITSFTVQVFITPSSDYRLRR